MSDPNDPNDADRAEIEAPETDRFEEGDEAPPRGVRSMALVRWGLLAAMVLAAALSVYSYAAPLLGQTPAGAASRARYRCPMHPQIVSDQPGDCPICHMSLEAIPADQLAGSQGAAPSTSASASSPAATSLPAAHAHDHPHAGPAVAPDAGAPELWTCPMDPDVKSSTPGSCPKCKMDLVTAASLAHGAMAAPTDVAPVTLSLDRVQAIGVRTALVLRSPAGEALRVVAMVEAPETGRAEVHTRAPGFLEQVRVNQTGVKVKAGEVLAAIYSPEVFPAEQELLTMSGWSKSTPGAGKPPIDQARKRLELLGVGGPTIDRIAAGGAPARTIGLVSPISGYVVKKSVVLGSFVTPELALYEIADLAHVYVVASVYPSQVAGIRIGDVGVFHTPSLEGSRFEMKVDLVYPEHDLATHTTRVRFQVKNDDLALRPGQYGTIELRGASTDVVTVPLDAVVDTGRSQYVFVVDGDRYVPTPVLLGEQVGERFVVKGGVMAGQRVVSGATFLIDAESRLGASLAGGR